MIWNDIHMSKRPVVPKWICYISSSISLIMAYCSVYLSIVDVTIMDKIIPAVASPFFIYYGICGVLTILKGDEYVVSIEKKKDCFILTDIFCKQTSFTVSDVFSVKSSKSSIAEQFFTGFAKHIPGLNLILKDGSKYYITSDMENIDTLKEHLLGKISEHI